MKIKTDYIFPEQYRLMAEEYISYKHSLGFIFGYDDQKKCDQLLRYLYTNSPTNDVTDLTNKLVDGYLEQFNGSKPRTVHANQSYIRQYGLFLKQRGYAPYIYPATLIRCPKDFTPYIFSKAEIYRIFNCADQIGPNKNKFVNTPYIYPAIHRLLYASGSRIGETVSLKTEDVNLSDGIITFHNGKNNVSRMLPISDSLTAYLRKYDSRVDRTGNAYFFPSLNGECYSPITIRNTFRKLMIQAKISILPTGNYPRIHDLRHTFAVHSLEQSIDQGLDPYCSLPSLSTYMGHRGVESTEYYLRLTKHYFINVLHYTQTQADIIFPEV
ncbi:tyrosine-type recombinase/integrase [Anaerocolumna sp. AGMB13025]|uniref:tyrosine-type recombinase/integrase n=1 Tax=Anaerocolumna sp. AGMB13025 TaxID=3039116 RepID=UPI00241BFD9E|nr:tyrosine-type recombinase/integrase [Anaerocolumna sp. AGMB13025]WFR57130.1 tyrosine-type recombinase/integrase [Anaerocolumna sp. AGMB13025]